MSEYKRLTLHNLHGAYDWDKRNLTQEQVCDMYDRLAEIEDKIENGTLIEFPRIIGFSYNWAIEEINENGVVVREFFRGRQAAEARLKELRGGK